MILPGAAGQQERHLLVDASGLTTTNASTLVLPEHKSRSFLTIMNIHASATMFIDFGSARAHATVSGGIITAITVDNAGQGFTLPPDVILIGGGNGGNSSAPGVAAIGYPAPGDAAYVASRYTDMSGKRPGKAHAVMTGSAPNRSVASIAIEDPGAGYAAAPLVLIRNNILDPFGVAIASATSGIMLAANGGAWYVNGPVCFTDPISVFSTTDAAQYTCKYMS